MPRTGKRQRAPAASAPADATFLETAMLDSQVQIHVNGGAAAWAALMASLPASDRAVGVDTEGIDSSASYTPPLMVQVASATVVVVETPKAGPTSFSQGLRRLLGDAGVVKVFFDASGDVGTLGGAAAVRPIVDAQKLAMAHRPGKDKLGLAAAIALGEDDGVAWAKRSFQKMRWWKLHSSAAMLKAEHFVTYAAADAWGTLRAYEALRLRPKPPPPLPKKLRTDAAGDAAPPPPDEDPRQALERLTAARRCAACKGSKRRCAACKETARSVEHCFGYVAAEGAAGAGGAGGAAAAAERETFRFAVQVDGRVFRPGEPAPSKKKAKISAARVAVAALRAERALCA